MQRTHAAAIASLLLGAAITLPGLRAQQTGIQRTDLQRQDLPTTGREVVQVRVELAPGVAFGRHTHPGEEIIYMLEGVLKYEVDGRPRITLTAGDVLFIPAGTVHAARNPGRTNGSELATYVLEKGKRARRARRASCGNRSSSRTNRCCCNRRSSLRAPMRSSMAADG